MILPECPPLRERIRGDLWAALHEMEIDEPYPQNPDEKVIERCQREGCEAIRVVDRQLEMGRWSE